ncbi:MAG: hypothetical protein ACTSYH_15125 [Candidatus Heimdallarchaeaceae archaeon]
MVEIRNWEKIIVIQQMPISCIATGFEWLLKYKNYSITNSKEFQEKYTREGKNFSRIKQALERDFDLKIGIKSNFKNGLEKIEFIEEKLGTDIPILISVVVWENLLSGEHHSYNYHIMPVVYMDKVEIKLHDYCNYSTKLSSYIHKMRRYTRDYLIWLHDNFSGGNDIAWFE